MLDLPTVTFAFEAEATPFVYSLLSLDSDLITNTELM